MHNLLVIFFVTFFHTYSISNRSDYSPVIIFWNIGQGQWITSVKSDECLHFDFGGEKYFFNKVKAKITAICKNKTNKLLLSHTDKDHHVFFSFLNKNFQNICWLNDHNYHNTFFSTEIPPCAKDINTQIIYSPQIGKNKNANSRIAQHRNILIPGDSPIKIENIWHKHVDQKSVQVLALGHHGSKTSTGHLLLGHLSDLKMIIAQARNKKYGHPHTAVIQRLKTKKLSILKTEDWGNIILAY